MYALHSLYSPPGRLQRSGLIVKYGLTSIHTIHTFLPCASSHPSLIRASPHPPIYLGCACPFPPSRDTSLTLSAIFPRKVPQFQQVMSPEWRPIKLPNSNSDQRMIGMLFECHSSRQ